MTQAFRPKRHDPTRYDPTVVTEPSPTNRPRRLHRAGGCGLGHFRNQTESAQSLPVSPVSRLTSHQDRGNQWRYHMAEFGPPAEGMALCHVNVCDDVERARRFYAERGAGRSERQSPMRSDIRPGGVFPDYSLPDHTNIVRTLSELQGDDPMILTLARGNYCPKEHQQHLELAANYPKIAVAYTQVVTIATDDHHTLQEFRGSVGAQWTFLSDPGSDDPKGPRHPGIHRPRPRSDDPPHAGAQAWTPHSQHLQRLLVLGTPVVLRPVVRLCALRRARSAPTGT